MRKQTLFVAVLGAFSMSGAAHAATVNISGSYTLGFTQSVGQSGSHPALADVLGTTKSGKRQFTIDNVQEPSVTLPNGKATNPVSFFTETPAGSSGISCGRKCNSTNDIATGMITATIYITDPFDTSIVDMVSDTALYQADYKGIVPGGCTDSGSTGQTDCIDWTNATTSGPGGYVTLPINLVNSSDQIVDVLDVILYNAQDWALTPTISFELTPPLSGGGQGATPLPATLPLLVGGLGFFGFLGRRRRKTSASAL